MTPPTFVCNRLLAALSPDDLAILRPHLKRVPLKVGDILVEPNQPTDHVYFPEDGIASVTVVGAGGERVEVGRIGREGVTGMSVIQGVDRSPHETVVQVSGSALRMSATGLGTAMEASPSLRSLLFRFVHVATVQFAQSALANGRHTIPERLARWLLMGHDRRDGDELPLTHESLSRMLGVRRSGVTEALHLLEGAHIVRASRGRVRVLDRAKLEEAAGGSYGLPEAEYRRVIG
jgi:CRP-like cAMP-binding protein